jgi:hypothetical protein
VRAEQVISVTGVIDDVKAVGFACSARHGYGLSVLYDRRFVRPSVGASRIIIDASVCGCLLEQSISHSHDTHVPFNTKLTAECT